MTYGPRLIRDSTAFWTDDDDDAPAPPPSPGSQSEPSFCCAPLADCSATIPVNTASAAPIDDLRAQAADIEQQMNTVGSQLGKLWEQIKDKQYEIDQARQTIADSQAGIVSAQGEVARITDLVRERAATRVPPRRQRRRHRVRHQHQVERVAEQVRRRHVAEGQPAPQQAGAREGRPRGARGGGREGARRRPGRSRTRSRASRPTSRRSRIKLTKLQNGVKGEIAELVAQEEAKRRAEEAARTAAQVVANPTSGSAPRRRSTRRRSRRRAVAPARSSAYAMAQLGKDYCYAGVGPDCFDCSGLTLMAWGQVGRVHAAQLRGPDRDVPAGADERTPAR